MMEPSSDLPPDLPVRRLSGPTGIALAFVAGTLVALLPMYHFYAGSTTTPREQAPAAPVALELPKPAAPAEGAERFASRMTYELTQTPADAPTAPVAEVAASASAPSVIPDPPPAPVRREAPAVVEERSASRVVNARPISATPPDRRDTTREIENEARRAEYARAPSRTPSRGQGAPQGRVFEGREVVIGAAKGSIGTRPIGAAAAGSTSSPADEGDPSRRIPTVVILNPDRKVGEPGPKAGVTVPGVTPIAPAPESPERTEPARKGASADGSTGRSVDVPRRLAATPHPTLTQR